MSLGVKGSFPINFYENEGIFLAHYREGLQNDLVLCSLSGERLWNKSVMSYVDACNFQGSTVVYSTEEIIHVTDALDGDLFKKDVGCEVRRVFVDDEYIVGVCDTSYFVINKSGKVRKQHLKRRLRHLTFKTRIISL